MNGKTTEVRSVWSAKDEAALKELTERKERIMSERQNQLGHVILQIQGEIAVGIDSLEATIKYAEALRDALAPFDGRAQ